MSRSKLDALLGQAHFLRGLDAEEIHALAGSLEAHHFAAGETIVHQGAPARALYIVAEGSIKFERHDHSGTNREVGRCAPGDLFGDVELLSGSPWQATASASTPTSVYRWPRQAVSAFVKDHPASLHSLRFSAQSHHLASKLRFKWLAEDEVVYGLARKHPVVLIQMLFLPILLFAIGLLIVFWGAGKAGSLPLWLAGGISLAGLFWGVWNWVDWCNDYYILTNRRAVWLEKVVGIYDSRREAPLHWILSVSVDSDMLGRILGYGNVVVRTYTGKVTFEKVGRPHAMAALVEEHWRRWRNRRQDDDRDLMIRSLQERLAGEEEGEDISPDILIEQLPTHAQRALETIGLGHWTLEMRYEQDGVITYRKHWALLLRQIALPSFFLLLSLALPLARALGWLQILAWQATLAASALIGVPMLGWWLYRYVDWANDLYQITPNQIVDVHKKPFASESRKVAPLENILGTEVDRSGILGLLLNFGAVITNVGIEQFIFEGVFDPAGVQQDIVRAQDAYLERQRESQRRERREEMVEWISAYHDEIAAGKKLDEKDEPQDYGHP